MRLLVGLGNPGPKYEKNRHNIGFMAVDEVVRRHSFSGFRSRFQGLVAEGTVDGRKLLILKPLTYMNRSGEAVGQALRFYKFAPEEVAVLYDEIDLEPGKLRVKLGGGHGGHNGLRSIDSHIGKDYWRVRMGVGHPGRKELVNRHVLSDFAKPDWDWVDPLLSAVAEAMPDLVADDASRFMSRVAHILNPNPKRPNQEDQPGADAEREPGS